MRDTWSLDVMYQGFEDKKFKADLDELDIRIQKLNQFAENLTREQEKETIKEGLECLEKFSTLYTQMMIFCELKQSVNTKDADSVS